LTGLAEEETPAGTVGGADQVSNLAVVMATDSTITLRWTEVDGGAGAPAAYQVKYAVPPIHWNSANAAGASTLNGTQIGAQMSHTISGLESGATYDVQLIAFRTVGGVAQGASYSNIATGTVGDSTVVEPDPVEDTVVVTPVPVTSSGIWVSSARLAQLPTSGAAWNDVLANANSSCGTVDLSDQEDLTNVCIMAKALVFARIGGAQYRTDVVSAINQIVSAPTYVGRALSLGRELGAYVIAADLINLKSFDPSLDTRFRAKLRVLRTTFTEGAATSLIDSHEKRPNNWGAQAGSSRVAIAAYLGDTADLARAAQVLRGYLGDRSAYAGFEYGADLSWQHDATKPVGVNPVGSTRSGLSLDGVLPDDQRRGGAFTTSPPNENYAWEAMQGLLAQAVMLERAGYAPFEWSDRALLRSARWLYDVNDFPAAADDTWQTSILNHYYGTGFPEDVPSRPGKNVGWTTWTHG
jgi:hypothetical protein